MHLSSIFRMLGVLLMLFSISMLPPLGVAWWYQTGAAVPFIIAFIVTLGTGFCLWLPCRFQRAELKNRDGFLIVILFWTVLSIFGALPFIISIHPHLTLTDAMFETVSGLTTTGSTVLDHLQTIPRSLLYYRQQLQFLGGMGIIVLAVAILPMLGVGGMQLYRAELPGPIKDTKLTPRLTETAKVLWYIYVGLNLACIAAYYLAGMSLFDAVGDTFGTISTGGFTVHDASFGFYKNPTIEMIACVFMLLGGTNFALHFFAIQKRSIKTYWQNEEFRFYIFTLMTVLLLVIIGLHVAQLYPPHYTAIQSIFAVISIGTTTGFTSAAFHAWPGYLPILINIVGVIGGCGASTSGGMKVIRLLLVYKQGRREVKRLIHPRATLAIKFGGQSLPEDVIQAMWSFIAVFIGLFIIIMLLLLATGMDLTTAFSSTIAGLANVGVGIGNVASGYENISEVAKWIMIFAMLAGRLEIFTLLVLFTPEFWRR